MNATLKKMLTKDLLSLLRMDIEEGKDFHEILSRSRNWVEELFKMAEAYNHTPKALTNVTPMEVHFPGRKEEAAKYFLANEEDERVIREFQQVIF
jgi:hypothetical protein